MSFFRALVLALLCCGSAAPLAADFTIREWTNDSKAFLSTVVEPLDAELQGQACVDDTGHYLALLFSGLRPLKTTVHSESYLLLRDAVLATAEHIAPFERTVNCQIIQKWRLVKASLTTQIEVIGNVLLILE